jgi:hypothetical protein
VLPNGNYYLPDTGEIIPADMATPSPDDRFRHCGYYPILYVFDPLTGQWDGGEIQTLRPARQAGTLNSPAIVKYRVRFEHACEVD